MARYKRIYIKNPTLKNITPEIRKLAMNNSILNIEVILRIDN